MFKSHKKLCILLGSEAVLCAVAAFLTNNGQLFGTLLTFPLKQIAAFIGLLSGIGKVGNIAAWAVYAIIALLPFTAAVITHSNKWFGAAEWVLTGLSIWLFPALYLLINPGIMGTMGFEAVYSTFICSGFWIGIFAYIALRVVCRAQSADGNNVLKYLRAFTVILAVLFVFQVFGSGIADLINKIKSIAAGNEGSENELWITYIFAAAGFIVNSLPALLNVRLIFDAIDLTESYEATKWSEETVEKAAGLSHRCAKCLIFSLAANCGYYLVQFLFMKVLRDLSGEIIFPVIAIIFLLCLLITTKLFAAANKLQDDSDSII